TVSSLRSCLAAAFGSSSPRAVRPNKRVPMSSENLAHDDRATIPKSSDKVVVAVTEQTKYTYGARIMLTNSHLQSHHLAHSPSRLRLALVACAALVCTLYVGPVHAADAGESAEKPQSGKLTVDPREIQKPWTGDLDGMLQRRIIRVLTVYSKTFYFTDKG